MQPRTSWPIWPIALLAIPAVLVLRSAGKDAMAFDWFVFASVPISLLWYVGLVCAFAGLMRAAYGWRWLHAALYAIPIVAALAISPTLNLPGQTNGLGDQIHFMLNRADYQTRARALPDTGEPKLKNFSRGGMVFASRGIVYDESDEIILPTALRSAAWKRRSEMTELSCGYAVLRRVGPHFYAVAFGC